MTDSDLAVPDHVMIRCPACGASEAADPAVLTDAPTIVCRKCGETWPAAPRRRKRIALPVGETGKAKPTETLQAERRPLVTYSQGVDKAWAAKMEGDYWPERPQQSRLPGTAATMAAILFIAAFLGGREAAVAALPDLAGLYAAVGLSVNLAGLAIEDVEAERVAGENGAGLTVRGLIRNVSGADQPVPPLTVSLYDSGRASTGVRSFDPPAGMIEAGATAPFLLELDGAPLEAERVVVRFRRPAEHLPGSGEGTTAVP